MEDSSNDSGVIAVLMKRLSEQRLPRALELKEKVDQGGLLDDCLLYTSDAADELRSV